VAEVDVVQDVRKACGSVTVAVAIALTQGGCGSDLGECDMAALALSTDAAQSQPYTGQRLVHQSCAAGQCHAESAKGVDRIGAPAGLNFDVVPADTSDAESAKIIRGESVVDENAEEMWEWISDGLMPPEGKRMPLEGADKETVRNWLACGAPVIRQPLTVGGRDWAALFPSLETTCGACHNAASTTGPWLALGDACTTRANLLGSVASGTGCGTTGATLIVPSSPDASLLLQKLESPMPCGTVMPPDRNAATPSALAAPLRQWIAAGALAPACP
jgi:mono/diheme cytochrome c family protein